MLPETTEFIPVNTNDLLYWLSDVVVLTIGSNPLIEATVLVVLTNPVRTANIMRPRLKVGSPQGKRLRSFVEVYNFSWLCRKENRINNPTCYNSN